MHSKYYFFLFLVFNVFYSQQIIKIQVKNSDGNFIEDVNVQLLYKNKTIDFKKTDSTGKCIFELSEKGVFSLKFTSMLYKSEIIDIDTHYKSFFDITLQSQVKEIESVEIKARPKIATVKEDTIVFNIKAIKDGTERTTEDLIKKIPGLDVNDNGKVSYKGNVLGQVLIDGNEFFGKNHKMATQNISAEMLEGIELWQNYATINGGNSSALNLRLKEEYKGKITGDLQTLYGSTNNYLFHSNLFKFNKLGNLGLVLDANSVAKDPISFMDFYEMNTQEDVEQNSSNNIDVPSFLNNDGKVKNKDNQFGAFQYSKNFKNIRITGFSIINAAQLNKLSTLDRRAYNQLPNFNFYETKREDNKGFFGTSQLKIKANFSDHNFLYYALQFNPANDDFNQNVERTNFININDNVKNNVLGNYLSWNKSFSDRLKIILSFNYKNESLYQNTFFASDNKLFGTKFNQISQSYSTSNDTYGVDFYVKNKNKWINVQFQSNANVRNENTILREENSQSNEPLNFKTYHYLNGLSLDKKIGNFDVFGKLDWHYLEINNLKNEYFEENIRIKYRPEAIINNELSLEYKLKYENPVLKTLQYSPFYSKELSYFQNYNVAPNSLSDYNTFRFTFHRFNLDKGNLNFLMLMYDFSNNTFTRNTINLGSFSKIENQMGSLKNRWILLYSNVQRLSKSFVLKSKITGMKSETQNFIQDKENVSEIRNFEINQKLSSNFKNHWIQFDMGYSYIQSNFKQSIFNSESVQKNTKIFLGIRTNIKKEWITNVLGEYFIQNTNEIKLSNFLLGGQISYKKEKSKFEYNLLFNNILNLNTFDYITNSVSEFGYEQSSVSALRGYVIGGLKFNF